MAAKPKKSIKNGTDPKGREVFLLQYESGVMVVEKPTTGYKSDFIRAGKEDSANQLFDEACNNSNF